MKTYSVWRMGDDPVRKASNLRLSEAFARLMALAGSDYGFHRYGRTMRLDLTRKGPVADMPFLVTDLTLFRETFPLFESILPDNDAASTDLMEQALRHGRGGVRAEVERVLSAIPDEERVA